MHVATYTYMSRLRPLCAVVLVAFSLACSSSQPAAAPVATTTVAPAAAVVSSPSAAAAVSSPSAAAAVVSPSAAAAASPSIVVAVASPSVGSTATPLPPPTVPSPTPATPPTSTPSPVSMVWVANTQGGGVFLRNSPHDGDRNEVLAENTPLTVRGELEEGDGQEWYPVIAPDNTPGYVPQTYTTMIDPQAAPLPLVPDQAK